MTLHMTPAEPTPRASKNHCEDHPEQNETNSPGGFGLAGGGFGPYNICPICGCIFNKQDIPDDEEY